MSRYSADRSTRAEVVGRVEHRVELIVVVGAPHALDQLAQAQERPPVQLVELIVGYAVPLGIEVGERAEQEPARVADTPVRIGQAIEDLLGDADVLRIVFCRHPQAQHLGAVLRDQLLGRDRVAARLGHLAAVAVDEEAVREHGAIRRRVARADRLEQRGVEPAAVLVRALEVHVGGPPEIGPRLEHGGVAAPRVEPHVEDVRLLAEARAAALRALRPRGQEVLRLAGMPLVHAVTVAHDLGHVLDQALLEQQRAARRAVEGDDRHAPDALARDHPLGPVGDHVEDALLAPFRDPPDVVADRVERATAQPVLVERDEPLLGGAEQRRVLAAPAVRIRVIERHRRDERADAPQVLDDLRIRIPHREPGEALDLGTNRPSSSTGL